LVGLVIYGFSILIVISELQLLFSLVLLLFVKHTKSTALIQYLEDKPREMLVGLNDGLNKLVGSLNAGAQASSERLKDSVTQELNATREGMKSLQL